MEFGRPDPDISKVKTWGQTLREALVAGSKWAAKKAVEHLTTVLVTAALAPYVPFLHSVVQAIADWLQIVTPQIPL